MLIFRWWGWWWWQWWWKIILQCLFSNSLASFHIHYFHETAQDLLDAAAKCHFYLSATSDTVDNFLLLVRSASLGFSDSKFSRSSYPSGLLNSITSQAYPFERLLVTFMIKSQVAFWSFQSHLLLLPFCTISSRHSELLLGHRICHVHPCVQL